MKNTPLKAIRKNCIDCMAGSLSRVNQCDDMECPFHIYRFGKNPKRKGIGGNKSFSSGKAIDRPKNIFQG